MRPTSRSDSVKPQTRSSHAAGRCSVLMRGDAPASGLLSSALPGARTTTMDLRALAMARARALLRVRLPTAAAASASGPLRAWEEGRGLAAGGTACR